MRQYLETEYYEWVQTACPYYTDHGKPHIQSVIQTAGYLLAPRLKSRSDLTTMDLFLMLAAIIWHDVGMVYGGSESCRSGAQVINVSARFTSVLDTTTRNNGIVTCGRRGVEASETRPKLAMGSVITSVLPDTRRRLEVCRQLLQKLVRVRLALLPDVPEGQQIYWQYARAVVGDGRNRSVRKS